VASYLFVCSGGGHLSELHTLAEQLRIPVEEQFWATPEGGLSRSLLAGREVVALHEAPPRAVVPLLRNVLLGWRILRGRRFDAVFSTGASPALSILPLAVLRGIPAHYIESAARVDGPSFSGRILARLAGVATYTQYRSWADARWRFGGAIFENYHVEDVPPQPVRRAVVSVGTQDGYPFSRFFEAVVPLLDGVEVLWQTGMTDVSGLGIQGRPSVPHGELVAAMAEADVVIAHGGVGTALSAIEQGRVPILVPRRLAHGEHVDDHQVQIAARLAESGLAVHAEAGELSREILERAASRRVVAAAERPRFVLQTSVPNPRSRWRRLTSLVGGLVPRRARG